MSAVTDVSDHANRLQIITQRVGFTLWQLQELEGCTAQLFVLLSLATKGMGFGSSDSALQKAKKRTFGTTITMMKDASLLPEQVAERFDALLRERNWLVHSSRASSRNAIHSDEASIRLVERLDAMESECMSLFREIVKMAEELGNKFGVDKREVEARSAQLLAEWHAADAI